MKDMLTKAPAHTHIYIFSFLYVICQKENLSSIPTEFAPLQKLSSLDSTVKKDLIDFTVPDLGTMFVFIQSLGRDGTILIEPSVTQHTLDKSYPLYNMNLMPKIYIKN
jgi:hypothetical protein